MILTKIAHLAVAGSADKVLRPHQAPCDKLVLVLLVLLVVWQQQSMKEALCCGRLWY